MGKYYTYTFTDPRNGMVFYVGKGKGNRCERYHKKEYSDNFVITDGFLLRTFIGYLDEVGVEFNVSIVGYYDTESEALEEENRLISFYNSNGSFTLNSNYHQLGFKERIQDSGDSGAYLKEDVIEYMLSKKQYELDKLKDELSQP